MAGTPVKMATVATPPKQILYLLYMVGFLDLLGVSMIIPMLGLHAKELGASPTVIGAIGSMYGLLQLFSSPVIGDWSDRAGRRIVLIYSLTLAGIGYLILGTATSIIMLFIARIPSGLFKHTQNLVKVALSDNVPKEGHAAVFGHYNSVSTLGFVIGPVLGGHLGDLAYGRRPVFVLSAGLFVMNSVIVWWFLPPDTPKTVIKSSESPKKSASVLQLGVFMDNLRHMDWTHLWDIFLVRFLFGFASIIFRSNFSLNLDSQFNISGKQIGYIISYVSVISTISGFFVGKIAQYYDNDRRLLVHVGIVQAISIFCSTFAPTMPVLIIAMAPLSVANAVARVCVTNITIDRVKDEETGAVLGCGASVLSVARMISPLLAGLVAAINPKGPGMVGVISALIGITVLTTTKSDIPQVAKEKDIKVS